MRSEAGEDVTIFWLEQQLKLSPQATICGSCDISCPVRLAHVHAEKYPQKIESHNIAPPRSAFNPRCGGSKRGNLEFKRKGFGMEEPTFGSSDAKFRTQMSCFGVGESWFGCRLGLGRGEVKMTAEKQLVSGVLPY